MNEWKQRVNIWINEWMDEWMNEWMDLWMNEWTNKWINDSINNWIEQIKHESGRSMIVFKGAKDSITWRHRKYTILLIYKVEGVD